MRRKSSAKALSLSRETLKTLTRKQLRGAGGGSGCDPNHSPSGCYSDTDCSNNCARTRLLE